MPGRNDDQGPWIDEAGAAGARRDRACEVLGPTLGNSQKIFPQILVL
jgi:hypothetical protein